MIGDRFVKISFTAEKNSKTPPMVSIEIVCADDPVITMEHIREEILHETTGKTRTRCLALIKAEQEQYNSCKYKEKAGEIKILDVFSKCPALVWI